MLNVDVVQRDMKTEEIEIYSDKTNSSIVRMPERRFPGVVIQGDSLSVLFHDLMSALEGAEGKVDRHTFLSILSQAEAIESHLRNYEEVLKKSGIPLPYDRDPSRSSDRFKHHWEDTETAQQDAAR